MKIQKRTFGVMLIKSRPPMATLTSRKLEGRWSCLCSSVQIVAKCDANSSHRHRLSSTSLKPTAVTSSAQNLGESHLHNRA